MANTKICGCCGTTKNIAQYYKSPIDSEYVPICKNCIRKEYKKNLEVLGEESAALWISLAKIGVPFIFDIWDRTNTIMATAGPNTDIIMTYLKVLNEDGRIVKGFWDSDRMLDQLLENNSVDRKSEEKSMNLSEQQKIWGKFLNDDGELDVEAYEYLNQTFTDYTSEIQEMDTSIERRYRDLAKAELRKREADESGDIQEIAKAQDNLKKILDMLKLSDFSNNKQSEIDKHISRMCWTIENTKPAECRDLEKYKDFSGFGKTWKEIGRCLQNLIAGTREFPDIPKGEE